MDTMKQALLGSDDFNAGGQIGRVAWSRSGNLVAAMANHQHLLCFAANSGRPVADLPLEGMQFFPGFLGETPLIGNHQALWRMPLQGDPEQLFAFDPWQGPHGWRVEEACLSADSSVAAIREIRTDPEDQRYVRLRCIDTASGRLLRQIVPEITTRGDRPWWTLSRKEKKRLSVGAIALSADGQRLIGMSSQYDAKTMTSSNRLLVWDIAQGTLVTTAPAPVGVNGVRAGDVTLCPDGSRLVFAGNLVDIAEHPRVDQLAGPAHHVGSHVAFIDAQRLFCADGAGACVLDARTGKPIAVCAASDPWFVLAVAVAPDGAVAAVADNSRLRLIDLPDLSPRPLEPGHVSEVDALAVSGDGRRVASSDGQQIIAWDVETRRPIAARAIRSSWGLALAPDGDRVLTTADHATVLRMDTLEVIGVGNERPMAVTWPQPDRAIAVIAPGDPDDAEGVITVAEGVPPQVVRSASASATRCLPVLAHDGRRCLLGHDDETWVCDTTVPRVLWHRRGGFLRGALSGDGGIAVINDPLAMTTKLIVVDGETGEHWQDLPVACELMQKLNVAFAAGRPRLAVAVDRLVQVFDFSAGPRHPVATLTITIETEHRSAVTALALSQDGRWLVTGGAEGRVGVIDLQA